MICANCCALEFASDDSLRALVFWQAKQIDRLTGGRYQPPDVNAIQQLVVDDEPEHAPDALSVMESLLWADDVFRKPPRAAAPRLIERLAKAGLYLTREEP